MLNEKQVELALFELKKLYEYCRDNIDSDKFPAEFALLIYNNVVMLGQPYDQIRQGLYDEQNDAEYIDYCQRMRKLVMQYIDRDEQGNPIFDENQQPKITDMAVEYGKATDELDKDFTALNERMMKKDEVNYNFLKQKVKVKICSITIDAIPIGIPPSIVGVITKPEV